MIHQCKCHVCGRTFGLRTYHDIEFAIRWPADGRLVYACGHSPQEIREAWIDFGFDDAPPRELEAIAATDPTA